MAFQKDSVFPRMRVIDNVEYGLKGCDMPKAELVCRDCAAAAAALANYL
jgi:ABC-type taurine transport system ATPase subunit